MEGLGHIPYALSSLVGQTEVLGHADDYRCRFDQLIDVLSEKHPDRVALLYKDEAISFRSLNARVNAHAAWLQKQLGEGDPNSIVGARIGVYALKHPTAVSLILAVMRVGAIVVPINPALRRGQVQHIVDDCDMALGFAPRAKADAFAQAADAQGRESCWRDWDALGTLAEPTVAGALVPVSAPPTSEEDIAILFYTSGSTGRPKGVMVHHHVLTLGAASVAHYLKLRPDDRILALLPLSFDYGFNQLGSSWIAGCAVVLHDFFLAGDAVKAIKRHNVTGIAAVPPLWHLLMEAAWKDGAGQTIRFVTNSGGKLNVNLQTALAETLPHARIFAMYGLTEAFRSSYLSPDKLAAKPGSMGQAIPFASLAIVDEEGKLQRHGHEGELVHMGPLVAKGYWQDEEKTKARFRPVPQTLRPLVPPCYHDRCVFSGDFAYADEDGDLHFVGRRDEMIKIMGNRMSPLEIEEVAERVEGIDQAVAFGIENAEKGADIMLVVEADFDDALNTALKTTLSEGLPGYAQPAEIVFKTALERNANGKVDRTALRQWVLAQQAQRLATPDGRL